MAALESTLWISNLSLCVCIQAHRVSLLCVHARATAWTCWSCANMGQPAQNQIKEFSKKLSKWNVDPAVCLQRGLSNGWRHWGIWGWVGQGQQGTWDSLWVTASEVVSIPLLCVPIQPTICPEQQYSSKVQKNPPVLLDTLLNVVVSSELWFYLKRTFSLGDESIYFVSNVNPLLKVVMALTVILMFLNGLIWPNLPGILHIHNKIWIKSPNDWVKGI